MIQRGLENSTNIDLPQRGTVSAAVLRQLIDLFNEYAKKHHLQYWFDVSWTSDGKEHDANVGISRSGQFEWLNLQSVEVIHPILRELEIRAGLYIKE